MYMGREILMFSPLLLYSGYRIWRLLDGKGKRILWTLIFLLLAFGYPLAESLPSGSGNRWSTGLMIAGYITLPYLLYLVLSVVLSDVIVGLGRLTKLCPADTVRRPRFRKFRVRLLLVLPAVMVAFGAWNFNRLQLRFYDLEIPKKSASVERFTIVFASDFHFQERTPRGLMDRFAAKVNAVGPDLVLIGGDILEGNAVGADLEAFADGFRRIQSTHGVFGVLGNHDAFGGGNPVFYEKAGIRMLRDEVERIDGAIHLAGRLDSRSRGRAGARKSIGDLLSGVPDDLPIVVLDHRPTDLENVGRSRADLQISGHTHNAQIFPLNIIARGQYDIAWGYGKWGRTHVIVSCGIQGWGPPVRTAGVSEILVIRLALR